MRTLLRRNRPLSQRTASGNVAVIFTLALLPILSAIGCAVDYSRATEIRGKLQSAIDAASVGSVARTSPGFIAAGAMTGGRRDAGRRRPTRRTSSTATCPGAAATRSPACRADVTEIGRQGDHLDGDSSRPRSRRTFIGVIGWSKLTITGTSTSRRQMPHYIDFYLLLDNSPSMGVGATPGRRRRRWSPTRRTNAPSPATTQRTTTTTTSWPRRSA